MEFKLLYWHWLVFGMALILAELFMPSFAILWFGLAGIVVAGALLIIPTLSFTFQILTWAILSLVMTIAWFKFFKPLRGNKPIARQQVIGEIGQVIKPPVQDKPGIMRFTTPLLGNDEWPFLCDQDVATGQRVFVKDISGKTLIVEQQKSK